MNTRILSGRDIQEMIRHTGLDTLMDELITRLTSAFLSFDPTVTAIPPRSGFSYADPDPGLIEWMPLFWQDDQVVIKIVGYHPQNPATRNLPTILSTVSAYDTATGHLAGLVDGVLLTALRTGAASAVASRYMAQPESNRLGLIGCGTQAVTQLHALSHVFDLDQVLIYDLDPDAVASFTERIRHLQLDAARIIPVSVEELVASVDILCTATSVDVGAGPVFDVVETRPWLHINAVGSDFPGKIEVPQTLLQRAVVCPDFLDQAVKEGECQQLHSAEIGPSLVELMQHPEACPDIQTRLSVFDSTGWALEDQVALSLFFDHADALGLGTDIEIESVSKHAKDPYAFLNRDMMVLSPGF